MSPLPLSYRPYLNPYNVNASYLTTTRHRANENQLYQQRSYMGQYFIQKVIFDSLNSN